MKITKLEIEGYKNLQNTSFDFSKSEQYAALIGINGSGKSNVLEAVSLIFYGLYYNETIDKFDYDIHYKINGKSISVKNGEMKVDSKKITKKNIRDYLPTNVIASYSGEELRMWENIYLNSYKEFFNNLKRQTTSYPYLLYINKYAWDIALITLMTSDKQIVKKFINKTLGINNENIEIRFDIDESKYGLYEKNKALSLIKRLSELQKEGGNGNIHINTIKTLEIGQKNNEDFTKKLFYYLFITSMPKRSDEITADKIITNIEFKNVDIKGIK